MHKGSPLPHSAPRLLLPDYAPLSTFGITLATSRLPNNLPQIGQYNAEKPLNLIEEEVLRGGYQCHLRSRIFFGHLSYVTHAAADICDLVKLEDVKYQMKILILVTYPVLH